MSVVSRALSLFRTPDEGDGLDIDPCDLEVDVAFELLKNQRRREVVKLVDQWGATTLSDMAEILAARENGVDEPTGKQRKAMYVALYQTHLPKMDAADVVDYNQDRGTVVEGDHLDACVSVLECGEAHFDVGVDADE